MLPAYLPPGPQLFTNTKVRTVRGAVDYLNSYRLPLTASQAVEYLRSLWNSTNLLTLYRHYFPTEFQASCASATLAVDYSGSGGLTCAYSPREKEFLELADLRLFPFCVDIALEGEEREDLIYVQSLGVDWWSGEFEELEGGWQLLLFVTGAVQRDFGLKVESYVNPDIQAILATVEGDKADWEKLKATCARAAAPLCYLPTALDMLDHDTGNIFLDPTDEMPADPLDWSIENIDFLVEQYQEAMDLNERAGKLLDWLLAGPQNLKEVIQLWNECQKVESESEAEPAENTGPRS